MQVHVGRVLGMGRGVEEADLEGAGAVKWF
jgi:hypothetical protein